MDTPAPGGRVPVHYHAGGHMEFLASTPAWVNEQGQVKAVGHKGRGYPALDAFRGLAAMIVVLYHVKGVATDYKGDDLGNGYLAVDLFFALSGFVLFHAYFDRFRRDLSSSAFMMLRLIRLYPLYLVGLAIGIAANAIVLLVEPGRAIPPLPFVANIMTGAAIVPAYPIRGQLFPLNSPCWSLMFELVANALMAMLWRYITPRRIMMVCAILATAMALYVMGHGHASVGNTWDSFVFGFVRCALSFCIGILIYMATKGRSLVIAAPNLLFVALCLIIAGSLLWSPSRQVTPTYDMAFILLISPMCILLGSIIMLEGWVVRICTVLGVTSYALYVTHYPMIKVSVILLDRIDGIAYREHLTLIAICYTLIFASISYALDYFYDFPVRRWLGRAFQKARAKPAA